MRILLLGNSFTYFNDMPKMIAALTGWEVVAHTRGGAWLDEHLDPSAELGCKTLPALQGEKWDCVILQEYSNGPIRNSARFMDAVEKLCALIRNSGAEPILYATWAYKDHSPKLATMSMTYNAMDDALYEAYHKAGERFGARVADVGRAFTATRELLQLYDPDDHYHPSREGSAVIAHTLIQSILNR